MSAADEVTFSHFGICTADLGKSLTFYTQALGFEIEYEGEAGSPYDVLTELPDQKLRLASVRKGAARIELLCFDAPIPVGEAARRPMNKLGMTHICVSVHDVDAAAARIEAFGGKVHTHTRCDAPHGEFMFCTDPNGVRIELWKKNEHAPF